jgi:hypothetical protein
LVGSIQPPIVAAQTAAPKGAGEYRSRSDEYSVLVRQAVDALVKDDAASFRKLLSPSLIKRTESAMGTGAIQTIIEQRFIPFFSDFYELNESVETIPTSDREGHKGLALFRSFRTEDGEDRPFAIYVLHEDGALVIGNLLLNKLLYDVVNGDAEATPGSR